MQLALALVDTQLPVPALAQRVVKGREARALGAHNEQRRQAAPKAAAVRREPPIGLTGGSRARGQGCRANVH